MSRESCDWVKVYCRLLESNSFMLACSESQFAPHAFLFAITAAGKARSGRFNSPAVDRRGAALKQGIALDDLQCGLVALQNAGFIQTENDDIEIVNWEKYQSVYASRLTHLPGAAPLTATSGTQSILNGEPDAISQSLPSKPAPARAGKTVSKPAYDLNDFPTLNTPEFAAAFEAWLAYRARRKPAVKTPALMLKKLSAYPVADAIAAMQESETMGYQGVFPEKLRGRAIAPARPKLVNIGPSEGFTADDLEF